MKDHSDLPPEVRALLGMFDLLDKALKPRQEVWYRCVICGDHTENDNPMICDECRPRTDCGVRIQ